MAGLSRRMQHIEALFAATIISMAESQARLADHLDERDKDLSEDENAADRRFFLRELIREFSGRGNEEAVEEARQELGPDSDELLAADEALLDAWAARNECDASAIRANRVRRIRSHLRWVEMVNRILPALPAEEAWRVFHDLNDGGHRSPLTARVRDACDRWVETTAERDNAAEAAALEGEPAA